MTRRISFALLAFGFLVGEILSIAFVDRPLSEYLRGIDASYPPFIDFFRAYTDLGKSQWYLWPAAFAFAGCLIAARTMSLTPERQGRIARAGHDLVFFFASIAISGLLTDAIKPLIGRGRPVEFARDHLYAFRPFTFHAAWNSMPSGHATTAGALAMALAFLFPRARFFWFLCCAALAISRVMVNAHYLSDIMAGIAMGVAATCRLARQRNDQGMFPFLMGIFPIDKRPFIP